MTKTDLLKRLLESAGKPKFNNKFDAPKGYEFNEEGYLTTNEPHPQVQVCAGYSFKKLACTIGTTNFLRGNLAAYKWLNPANFKTQAIGFAKWVLFSTGLCTLESINEEEIEVVVEEVYAEKDILPTLKGRFIQYYTIWRAKECTLEGRKQIATVVMNEAIGIVREKSMETHTRWNVPDVSEAAKVSESSTKKYFKEIGFPKAANRKLASVLEAMDGLLERGLAINNSSIGLLAGLDRKTVAKIIEANSIEM